MADWPHAPAHRFGGGGAYIVTAGTYMKVHHFRARERLTYLQDTLLELAQWHGWQLQAWAVFSNHYHFIAQPPDDPTSLPTFLGRLHSLTAREINRLDGERNRTVWFNYWDTHLTYERSYMARLRYVHQNAVRHGLVTVASAYPWCSAGWFEQRATPAFVRTVNSFGIDQINIFDDFEVEPVI